MEKEYQGIQYFLYARKSSESEDRQVQSIEDQVDRLKRLAFELKLEIKEILAEAKSAKKPNNRPVFDDMIKRIEKGEASGILCWQINRLTRNPIDSGKIGWLLQQGILKSIQSIDRQYLPEDNVLLFSVESGVANQFILDLKKNTKRGMMSKYEKGWQTGMAPLGYLNDKDNRIIVKDPERFSLIRKMWDLMLTGNYTPLQILDIANKDWGFTTRKFKRRGGDELSRSGIYRIFGNHFYAGIIENNGVQYQGKHEPLITYDEYDRVQVLLGRKNKPKPKTHEFAFTGLIRCGECGCLYTAQTKTKIIKKTGLLKEYTYYHCTRKTKRVNCTQKKALTNGDLELQIKKKIIECTILPDFLVWALNYLNQRNDTEIENRTLIYETLKKTLTQTQNELDELTKMRYRQLIDDNAFIREKNDLQGKISRIKGQLRDTEKRAEKWLELTERSFKFTTYALSTFLEAKDSKGLELKRKILFTLAKTSVIKGETLIIDLNEWLVPIKNNYPPLEAEYLRLEPDKIPMDTEQSESLASIRSRWVGVVDDVRTIIEQSDENISIPDLQP